MKNNSLNIKNVLEIIFNTTKKKGNILAEYYLIKNSSIISKWKNCVSKPSIDDLEKIVEFAYKESSDMQRKIIKNEIECLIIKSNLNESMKNSLIGISNFKEFLSEVLNVATAGKDNRQDSSSLPIKEDQIIKLDKTSNAKGLETLKAFSDDKENTYSGEVEFDLVLSNEKGEKSKIRCSGVGNFNMGIMNGTLKKRVGYASFFGIIVVSLVAGFFAINAGSKSRAMEKKSVISHENKIEQNNKEHEVLSIEEPKTKSKIEIEKVSRSDNEEVSKQSNDKKKADDEIVEKSELSKETMKEAEKKISNNSKEDNKVPDTKINSNTNSNGNKNIGTNNTDNSDNDSIVIENSSFVGNNNVIGYGNNININVEN